MASSPAASLIPDSLMATRMDRHVPSSDIATEFVQNNIVNYVFGRRNFINNDTKIFINAKDETEVITYGQAHETVHHLATGLIARGLERGDCICIHSYNNLGIVAAGGVATGSNPAYTPPELVHHFEITKPRYIIAHTDCLESVLEAAKTCQIPEENIFQLGSTESPAYNLKKSWTNLLRQANEYKDIPESPDLIPRCATRVSDPAAYAATSGTTGLPKAAKLTHRYFIGQLSAIEELFANRKDPVVQLHCLPVFHAFAAPLTLLLPLRLGVTTFLLPRFNQDEFVDCIEQHKVTDTAIVPPIVANLAKLPAITQLKLQSLRFVICAGAPLTASVQSSLSDVLHYEAALVQCWGCTEVGWISCFNPEEKDVTGSVGRLLSNETSLKIVSADGTPLTDDGARGEAFIKSSTVFDGYRGHKGAISLESLLDPEGYYGTGDIVYIKQGKIYIDGRIKDIMKVNGWQVSPEELQNVIMELQDLGVQDCAVAGRSQVNADGIQVTLPRAYVVKAIDSTITGAEIRAHVKKNLVSYKQLSGGVAFVKHIPRNPTGKILRHKLETLEILKEVQFAEAPVITQVIDAELTWREYVIDVLLSILDFMKPNAVIVLAGIAVWIFAEAT